MSSDAPHADAPHSISQLAPLRAALLPWRSAGEPIALVPTMGALHDGHLELIRLAKTKAPRVVVSIFVNPRQFAPQEDFDRYPRDLAADVAKLATAGCDLVWAPEPEVMYPSQFATTIVPKGAAEGLEGDVRPHFFAGVATVCTKLFNQVAPDFAVFGEKDYQQLAVIRQIVRDLDLCLEIVPAPIVRETDGLAMSSRNRYLIAKDRQIAPAMIRSLERAAARLRAGSRDCHAIEAEAAAALLDAGFAKVDYVAVRDAATLRAPNASGTGPLRVLAAAWLGNTRLIDNVAA